MAIRFGIELPVVRVNGRARRPEPDLVAVEEPLEIRLGVNCEGDTLVRPVAVTMRTPGCDDELAAGFLFTEGILQASDQIDRIERAGPDFASFGQNTVLVHLRPGVTVNFRRLQRNFYATSSCGVCGKTSIDAVRLCCGEISAGSVAVAPEVLHLMPEIARQAQAAFDVTGGLHAAALFTSEGELVAIREDVGRHNALDKLIGSQFLSCHDMSRSVLLVSGRASFELVQKAAVARIPILAAVGAPSSLAAELAIDCNMTLVGFVRNHRFNVYSAPERVIDFA
jgi:FdhD protein